MAQKTVARVRRRERKNIVNGIVYVNATFETDEEGIIINNETVSIFS